VTIFAVPVGRGRRAEMRLSYRGPQSAPFLARVGEVFTVAGVTWRVRRVEP
jgi:hypothetical protein